VNTDELELARYWAERRVREIQTKLHRWAIEEPHRRFDDLYNLVCDSAFLLVAWDRVGSSLYQVGLVRRGGLTGRRSFR
jgi:RNA-directed DNA polymerase